MGTNSLPYRERVRLGKLDEAKQVIVLQNHGYVIEDATKKEDMKDKIDRWFVLPDKTRASVQIKGRDPDAEKAHIYVDILACLYEPYLGLENPLTTVGRDELSKYEYFTCRVQNDMHLISGEAQKKLIQLVMNEWVISTVRNAIDEMLDKWVVSVAYAVKGIKTLNLSYRADGTPIFAPDPTFFWSLPVYKSKYTANDRRVQVRCTQDKKNHRPKILMFIPPGIYTKKESRQFSMTDAQ